MTTQELQQEHDEKCRILYKLREEEMITWDAYEALLERVKNETFFAVSVMCDIDSLPTIGASL